MCCGSVRLTVHSRENIFMYKVEKLDPKGKFNGKRCVVPPIVRGAR